MQRERHIPGCPRAPLPHRLPLPPPPPLPPPVSSSSWLSWVSGRERGRERERERDAEAVLDAERDTDICLPYRHIATERQRDREVERQRERHIPGFPRAPLPHRLPIPPLPLSHRRHHPHPPHHPLALPLPNPLLLAPWTPASLRPPSST